MKENDRCFIKTKTGHYKEITYKELNDKRKTYITYRSKKFIKLSGILLEVSKSEYKIFESEANRLRYINRAESHKNVFSYDQEDEDDINYKDTIPDFNCNVEQEVEQKMEIEKLKEALLKLSNDEYELIKALYYEQKTIREYAENKGIPFTTVESRKDKILNKLKKYLKN